MATKAFSSAYQAALHSDDDVCAVLDGVLYRVFADGTKKRIKAEPNKVYRLRA